MRLAELAPCMMCKSEKVISRYLEDGRYRVECFDCGQYLEFNAPSEMAARVMWNRTFRNDFDVDKVVKWLEMLQQYFIYSNTDLVKLSKVIEIVKGGGKDEL